MTDAHRPTEAKSLRDYANEIAPAMQCNCDLDNWEPERSTGHSHVCRIHKAAVSKYRQERELGT